MNELIITNYKNSTICAVYEDKIMTEVSVSRKKDNHLGNIYVGRIDNIVKNINAAFVNIQDNLSCYLDLSAVQGAIFVKKQSEKKISIGDELIVQVQKEEVKTKAPVLTTSFSLSGKYAVVVHNGSGLQISKKITSKAIRNSLKEDLSVYTREQVGIVIRTNAEKADRLDVVSEIEVLLQEYDKIATEGIHKTKYSLLYKELPQYLVTIRDAKDFSLSKIATNISCIYKEINNYLIDHPVLNFENRPLEVEWVEDASELAIRYKINHFMDQALKRMVYLNSGGTIVIEPTEALTVIDVNTGKAIAGKKKMEETFLKINMEAAKEIAAQIRLRNISGIILIDFINMAEEASKDMLLEKLREYFKMDPVQTELVDITKLGLVEITRKKICKTLSEQLLDAQ